MLEDAEYQIFEADDAGDERPGDHPGIAPCLLGRKGHCPERAFRRRLQKAKPLEARRALQKPINLDELLRAIQYELQH